MATIPAPTEFQPLPTTREERGREIARRGGIQQIGSRYVVPSQSQSANSNAPTTYVVDLVEQTCTCPDHAERGALGLRCKHIEAALFYVAWEGAVSADDDNGAPKPKPKSKRKRKRKKDERNWPVYNDVMRHEVDRLRPILKGLCALVPEPDRLVGLPGRKPIPLRDLIFAMVMKVYTCKSGRSAESEIRLCAERGYITKAFQHNKIHSAMEDEALTAILEWLVEQSAIPLAVVENSVGHFSQDSTGFATSIFGKRWRDHKYPKGRKQDKSKQDESKQSKQDESKQDESKQEPDDDKIVEPPLEDGEGRRQFVKLHITSGAVTHGVTCAKVSSAGDCKRLPEQLQRTAQNFTIKQFSADKAYLTQDCVNAIAAVGAQPLIPFKRNSKNHPGEDEWAAWNDMWAIFQLRRQAFLDAYHGRVQCESTVAMIKRFGPFVRSKLPVAQANEIYCKVIAHNLACIIMAVAEFGIETPFKEQPASSAEPDADVSSEDTVVTLKLVK